jgi:hypothetical protein
VSKDEWRERCHTAPTLGALLANYARAGIISEATTSRCWKERPLGRDFERLRTEPWGQTPVNRQKPRRGRARRV